MASLVASEVAKAAPDWVDVNELAAEIARDQAGALIVALNKSQQATIRSMVARGIEQGWSDRVLERRIADVVGLDPRSALAVENYRTMLDGKGTPPGRLERMAKSYAKRLLKHRANVIASTEVRTALGKAQQVIWQQQQAQGDLSPYAVRIFRTAKDEMTCPICRPLNGRRFSLKDASMIPPLHPNCRCTMELSDRGEVVKIVGGTGIDVYVPDAIGSVCPVCGEAVFGKKKHKHRVSKGDVIRRVRTPEGMAYYNLPIGAPIGPDARRIGVASAGRRQVTRQRAHDVFVALSQRDGTGPHGYVDAGALKAAVNKKINSFLLATLEGDKDSPFSEWVHKQVGDDADYRLARLKEEYTGRVNEGLRRWEFLTADIRENEGRLKDAKDALAVAQNDNERKIATDLVDSMEAWLASLESDLKEKYPDGKPEGKEPDFDSDEFKDYIKASFPSRLDFKDSGFAEMDDLSPEDIVLAMFSRDQLMTSTRATVDNWASTSLDHSIAALTLQYATTKRFQTEGWGNVLDYLAYRNEPKNREAAYYERLRKKWDSDILSEYADNGAKYDAYVEAMYQVSQNEFKAQGIEEVTLYRGMEVPKDVLTDDLFTPEGQLFNFNPLTSWAHDEDTAKGFSGNNGEDKRSVIFTITVPRERVFSSAVTGLGCQNENEFVLLGGDYRVTGVVKHDDGDYYASFPYVAPVEDFGSLPESPSIKLSPATQAALDKFHEKLQASQHTFAEKDTLQKYAFEVEAANDFERMNDILTMWQKYWDMNTAHSVRIAFLDAMDARRQDIADYNDEKDQATEDILELLEPYGFGLSGTESDFNVDVYQQHQSPSVSAYEALNLWKERIEDELPDPDEAGAVIDTFEDRVLDADGLDDLNKLRIEWTVDWDGAFSAKTEKAFFDMIAAREKDYAAPKPPKKVAAKAASKKIAAKKVAPKKMLPPTKTLLTGSKSADPFADTVVGQQERKFDSLLALINVSHPSHYDNLRNAIREAVAVGELSKQQGDALLHRIDVLENS